MPTDRRSDGVVSLQHHLETMIASSTRRIEEQITASHNVLKFQIDSLRSETVAARESAQRAMDKADKEMTTWREGANEFRAALSDAGKLALIQAEKFITRDTLDDRDIAIEKRIGSLESWQANITGRTAIIGGAIVFVSSLMATALATMFNYFLRR